MPYIPGLIPTEIVQTLMVEQEQLLVKEVSVTEALNNISHGLGLFFIIIITLILFFGFVLLFFLSRIFKFLKLDTNNILDISVENGKKYINLNEKKSIDIDGMKNIFSLYETIEHSEGGVLKRIDENRELLELLYKDAPDFIGNHKWVIEWFKSQDNFLLQLAEKTTIKKSDFIRVRPFPIDKE